MQRCVAALAVQERAIQELRAVGLSPPAAPIVIERQRNGDDESAPAPVSAGERFHTGLKGGSVLTVRTPASQPDADGRSASRHPPSGIAESRTVESRVTESGIMSSVARSKGSNLAFAELLDSVPGAWFFTRRDGSFAYVSLGACEALG